MHVKIVNGNPVQYPYTMVQFRRDNPNTSFPVEIPDTILETYGVHRVRESEVPSFDSKVQELVTGTPVLNGDGWETNYSISNRPQEEAEYNVRCYRDSLLTETDYLAMSDNTLSTEMATYRQALRDVPSQAGFPDNITWPTKP